MEGLEQEGKQNKAGLAVGIDLTDRFSQISAGFLGSGEVDTLSPISQNTGYLVPTALFKRSEVKQWFAGFEAQKCADTEVEGFYVDCLLERCREGSEIIIGKESFTPVALLALFVKRLLANVTVKAPVASIQTLMITLPEIDGTMVEILRRMVELLGLKTNNVYFQSHTESFYYYNLYQDTDLWKRDVCLFEAGDDSVETFKMSCNENTTPIVAIVEKNRFEMPILSKVVSEDVTEEDAQEVDRTFLEIAEETIGERLISSVYLIGDAFKGGWRKESTKTLCRRGRLFQGNNLFSKGACYAAMDKLANSEISKKYVFLGDDKLKSNIGMNVDKRGTSAYMALLDAGHNWFESSTECDIILNQGNRISFVVTPLTGEKPQVVDITLDDLPKRPPKTTRLHLQISMKSVTELVVRVKDMGFGELYPSSDIEWNEVICV